MKTIKIKYVSFWKGVDFEEFFLTKILKKYYNVEFSENPDYIICSGSGFYEYLKYDQIRIMFSGENYIPDFNYVDYAFSVYPLNFVDRHFSFPGLVLTSYDPFIKLSQKDRNYSCDILMDKPFFANMIASHEAENGSRGKLLSLLSQYRRVESAGSYLNNMPDGITVSIDDGSKSELQKKCKFTLCSESLTHDGFITEKIFDAFLADTIPIYSGSSTISEIINKNAYIDIRDYETLEEVVERIIELDKDDEKYLEILRQPVFVEEDYIEKKVQELEQFVRNIFDQPLEKAYRRSRLYMPLRYEQQLLRCKKYHNSLVPRLWRNVRMSCKIAFWRTFEAVLPIKRYFFKKVKSIFER